MRIHLAIPLALVATATSAAALDLPARRPGLWEMNMTFEDRKNMPSMKSEHCIDAETDKLMNTMGNSMEKDCSKKDVQHVGNTIVMDSVCKFGDATTTSHGVVSGDFNSAYTVKVTSTREGGRPTPGATPGAPTNMTIEARWMSACKPGQKPGDIMMPNGMKMNIRDLPKAPPAAPKR